MQSRRNGAATASQNLTADLHYYTLYTTIDITATGDIRDISQKNFEVIVQAIGLRAMPVILNNPRVVPSLSAEGSLLPGSGWVWRFATEVADVFREGNNPAGLLTKEIAGIVLPTAIVVTTSGPDQNCEFVGSTF